MRGLHYHGQPHGEIDSRQKPVLIPHFQAPGFGANFRICFALLDILRDTPDTYPVRFWRSALFSLFRTAWMILMYLPIQRNDSHDYILHMI